MRSLKQRQNHDYILGGRIIFSGATKISVNLDGWPRPGPRPGHPLVPQFRPWLEGNDDIESVKPDKNYVWAWLCVYDWLCI